MKILLTGSGSGGHFYPLIAIAEEINARALIEHLIPPQLYFMGPHPYDEAALTENNITFVKINAGKVRRYASIWNITDSFKTFIGIIQALLKVFSIFPDVIFSKGGYTTFPVMVAARVLRIPVVIHESDSKPGRANLYAAKFAEKIAISYPVAAEYFPSEKTALTGIPVRAAIKKPQGSGAREFLKLEKGTPVIVVVGGSQGAMRINNTILDALPDLVDRYEIIHQTGKANVEDVKQAAGVILKDNPHVERYHVFPYLSDLSLKMAAGVANVFVSRAGSSAISEIALWGIPSILLPLSEEVGHDQTHNAIHYARSGACVVIEDKNLTPHVLTTNLRRILESKEEQTAMSRAALAFAEDKKDAAQKIVDVLLEIGLRHEK
jgi:UDP-N-acetylglucosamine--N-acetylmuramyl-(pentapeptide) pyrophosphoryl-undecaprenol N-acetylglucosamine transferase